MISWKYHGPLGHCSLKLAGILLAYNALVSCPQWVEYFLSAVNNKLWEYQE